MEKSMLEPPETPAPLFALRAFKTALFGTPKEPEDEEVENVDEGVQAEGTTEKDTQVQLEKTKAPSNAVSPSKPQGILMTPGTTTTHRKTVSFGLAVMDNEGKPSVYTSKTGLPQNYPGKFPSPWTTKSADMESKKSQTALTKSLYEVRDQSSKSVLVTDEKAKQTGSSENDSQFATTQTLLLKNGKQEAAQTPKNESGSNADATLDLNEPRSRSGRHWKSKYERQHDRSKEEIRKLIKYKELARSYAKKKDSEKDGLSELLGEERRKVRLMEEEISKLAGEIAGQQMNLNSPEEDGDSLEKQLAHKTAKNLEYKRKVGHREEAEEIGNGQISGSHWAGAGFRTIHSGREQSPADLGCMKLEIDELHTKMEDMTRLSQQLEKEKGKLIRDLSEVQEDLARSEKRRQAQEARYKQREARFEEKKQQLEARLSSQDAYDQEAGNVRFEPLRTEIESLKRQLDLQKQSNKSSSNDCAELSRLKAEIREQRDAHIRASKDYKSQIARLTADATRARASRDEEPDIQLQQRKLAQDLRTATEYSADLRLENERVKQELRTLRKELQNSPSREDAAEPMKRAVLKSSRHRQPLTNSIQSDLNAPSFKQDLLQDRSCELRYQKTSVTGQERPISQESSVLDLPSPENFSTSNSRGTPRGYSTESRGLPNFSIASSPPQMMADRVPSKQASQRSKTSIRQRTSPSLSSQHGISTRTNLPPDRVAAAKARLAQKNAEKRKLAPAMEESQKEN